jgi:TPR repeat protein
LKGEPLVAFREQAPLDESENPLNRQGKISVGGLWRAWGSTSLKYKIVAVGATLLVALSAYLGEFLHQRPRAYPSAEGMQRQTPAGHLYDEGIADLRAGQNSEAATSFLRAAELGDPRAMAQLGELYLSGKGLTQNETEAVLWFRKAADAGDSLGMFYLGTTYHLGRGVGRNSATAAVWYKKAAEAGNADAMYILGKMYENGDGITEDQVTANQLYRKAVITRGLTTNQVRAILGTPMITANLGNKEIYVYKDLKIILMNGKVSDVQ